MNKIPMKRIYRRLYTENVLKTKDDNDNAFIEENLN